jgi:hypothetical protein
LYVRAGRRAQTEVPVPSGIRSIFTIPYQTAPLAAVKDSGQCTRANPALDAAFAKTRRSRCTKSGHPPVDGLHSIEKSTLTNPYFSLTQKIEGVKQDRSLTASKFFRLVRRPGLKPDHFLGAS